MRMEDATGSAACHVSGARFSSREPRRERTCQASEAGTRIRATPIGPKENQDWLDAPNASSNRFDTLERLVRNQAQIVNDIDARIVDHGNRHNDYASKLDKLNMGYIGNDANLREACRNIVDRYTAQEQSRALDEKVDLINAQVQAIMSAVASMNIPVMTTDA